MRKILEEQQMLFWGIICYILTCVCYAAFHFSFPFCIWLLNAILSFMFYTINQIKK